MTDIQKLNLSKLTEGLTEIMKESYPLCRNDDAVISHRASKINNTAHELKKQLDLIVGVIT